MAVKLINVKPGEILSLQLHHYRSEHWVVVDGLQKLRLEVKSLHYMRTKVAISH